MPSREIILFPDERLKRPCLPVKNLDAGVFSLMKDLEDTLYGSPGVGLAAPQIGATVRAIAVDVTRKPPPGKSPSPGHGLLILVNPIILKREGEQEFREGCLSIPEFLAKVRRAARVHVEGLNSRGEIVRVDAEGFEAVALQHEIDHLDGILFLDRVENVKTDLFRRKNFGALKSR